jgi:ribosomal protein S27E
LSDRAPNKHALYTKTERRPHTCTVECSDCREETRVNYIELAALLFPVHFHMPFIRYHQSWLRCPACGKRTWVRLHFDR